MNGTRNDTSADQRPVDVIVFPGPSPIGEARSWAVVRRRFHGLVDLILVTLVIILTVAVARLASVPRPAEPVGAASITAGSPRMIAPETASAGEQIVVLVYAYRGRCGATELRFDDAPVAHRLSRYLGSPNPDWIEMFMILDVPADATRGRHEIQLYGPGAGGTGSGCGAGSTDHALLATLTITLGP
jgi:hypothetical protein